MQQESSGAGKARRRRRAKALALKREGHGVKRDTAQEAATFQRINYALSATLDLGEILQRIITEVVQLLVAQSASVILHDDVTHEAELITTYGQGATVQTLRYPLPGSLTGWVAEHQRPLRVSRLSQDEWPTVWQLAEQLGATPSPISVLLAPLWVQGKIVGSLEVVWEEGHVITDSEERLLEAIAVQAAIGITHAQLYQEKERALRAVQESEQRLKAQYQGIPVPTYTWQRRGEDLVLVEYNHAANTISHGRIAELVGITAAELYHDAPDLLTLITRCLTEQRSLKKERFYQLRTTGERKQLAISYVFVPPDLVMVHTEDITERKQAEEALRHLSGRLLRLQDEERRKIARELHDSTAQNLIALRVFLFQVKNAEAALEPRVRQFLAESLDLAEQCISEVRTISYLLHPPFLEEMGLASALGWYTEGFTRRSSIKVTLEVPPEFSRLSDNIELVLFRIVQESLTNILYHSGSSVASIRLLRDPSHVILTVTDEGRGMEPEVLERMRTSGSPMGVGIAGMHERVRQLGGQLEIYSGNQGTIIMVTLPVEGGNS